MNQALSNLVRNVAAGEDAPGREDEARNNP
jgi:hypothetical protein